MSEKRLNVGLIGLGYWGPNLLRNLAAHPQVNVTGCCDLDPERLAGAARRYPDMQTFGSCDDMWRAPDIEAVLVATPVPTHFDIAKQALEHGKHVFIEKPMATSTIDALDLVNTAEDNRLTLMVGHTFLYSPPVNKIKRLIDSGDLGDIYYISSSRVNLGIHQSDVSVIWDLAPHDFSIIFYWLDEEPSQISANGRDFIQSGIHDVAFVDLKFPSGTVAHVHDSWLSPSKRRQMTIVGSKKMVVYDDTRLQEQVRIFNSSVRFIDDADSFGKHQLTYRTGDIITPRLDAIEPLMNEIDHFVSSVIDRTRPLTDGMHGLAIVKALEAADLSIKSDGVWQENTPVMMEIDEDASAALSVGSIEREENAA